MEQHLNKEDLSSRLFIQYEFYKWLLALCLVLSHVQQRQIALFRIKINRLENIKRFLGLKADTREGGCKFMFYYVSLEQNNTSTLGASNAQQEHVNSINIIGKKTWKIQKTSINSPKFQINLKDKKKGVIKKNCYLLVSKENSAWKCVRLLNQCVKNGHLIPT